MTSLFWGLRLEPGKRYTTTVDKSFHVSMAALDCSTVKEKDIHSVMLEEGESNIPFILCNLQKPKVLQSRLDLNFMSGDRVTFYCIGNGVVHLSGYLVPEDDEDDFTTFDEEGEEVEEEEDEDNDEEEENEEKSKEIQVAKGKAKVNGLPSKRKSEDSAAGLPSKKKKPELQIPGDSEDSDEDEVEDEEDDSGEEEEEEMDEEMEDEETEEESDEVETKEEEKKSTPPPPPANLEQKSKKKKKNKKDQQSPTSPQQQPQQQGKQKQQNAQENATQQKKKAQQPGQQSGNEKQATAEPKKTLEGGVTVKDVKVGNGPLCKPGRMVTVFYTGRLKSNNKVFDQSQHGAGFKFRVGRGEVIKGWDVGLAGMKVGGKRIITCPPAMAYGQRGSPPTIPPNSSLVFEVELKAVN